MERSRMAETITIRLPGDLRAGVRTLASRERNPEAAVVRRLLTSAVRDELARVPVIRHVSPRPWRPEDGPREFTIAGGGSPVDDEHAEFIAHARDDIPALLAEVERLRSALRQSTDRNGGCTEREVDPVRGTTVTDCRSGLDGSPPSAIRP